MLCVSDVWEATTKEIYSITTWICSLYNTCNRSLIFIHFSRRITALSKFHKQFFIQFAWIIQIETHFCLWNEFFIVVFMSFVWKFDITLNLEYLFEIQVTLLFKQEKKLTIQKKNKNVIQNFEFLNEQITTFTFIF